jgi:hypothetical protein
MIYRLQNRYQDSGWEHLHGYHSDNLKQLELTAKQLSENSMIYGMVRVVSSLGVHSVFSGGYQLDPATNQRLGIKTVERTVALIQPVEETIEPAIYHGSPNNATPGSFVDRAERWYRTRGLTIPDKRKFPHSFQGMLDDFSDYGGD